MNNSVFLKVKIDKMESTGSLLWDYTISMETGPNTGSTNFCHFYSPIGFTTKRKAIKELVKRGGERGYQHGKLYIYFDDEAAEQTIDWLNSLRLAFKINK